MKRARLAAGLDVTAIGLGTAPLGGLFSPVSDADAEATIERAWSLGVRFFDTAPLYGFGLAERRLGSFLRRQQRDSFAISTKVGRLLRSATAATEVAHYKGTPARRAAAIRLQLRRRDALGRGKPHPSRARPRRCAAGARSG